MRAPILLAALGAVVLLGCPAAPKPPEAPPPAPQIVSFTASPDRVKPGGSVTLSWETKDATSVRLEQVGKGVVSGADALSGSVELTPEADALYVLTATNDRGLRARDATSVEVDDGATEVLFVATPSSVRAGEPVMLAWNARGANAVSLAPKGGAELDLRGQRTSGSIEVRPMGETVYVLTVDGKPFEATVKVTPSIEAFSVTPGSALPGQPLTLSWKTSGAQNVTVSLAGPGELLTESEPSRVADGSFTWTVPPGTDPAAAFTFTLAAHGATLDVVEKTEAVVYIAGAPKVREWRVPTYAPEGGSFTVSWTTTGADELELLRDGTRIAHTTELELVKSGSFTLDTAPADSSLKIRALNRRGGVDVSEKSVNPVGPLSFMDFTAAPLPGINQGGEPVMLTWNVPNARNLKIVANNQIVVHQKSGPLAGSGSIDVYPNADTTYVLTADDGMGHSIAPASRAVTVATPARLTFSPNNVPSGSMINLTGTTVPMGGNVYGLNFPVKNAAGDTFVDISATGTSLAFAASDDTGAKLLTLPEPFLTTWAGIPVGGEALSVNINGWMKFSATAVTGDSAPTDPGTILVFRRDLKSDATTQVYWQLDGTGDQRRLIIQWTSVPFYYSSSPNRWVTFQAQLYANGEVVYAYKDFVGMDGTESGPEIGIYDPSRVLIKPFAHQLNAKGMPLVGDSLRFFGRVPMPFPIIAGNAVVVAQEVGNGRIMIQDQPQIRPAGEFIVSEVNYNPATGADQWFEVQNATNAPIDLTGWDINFGGGVTHTLTATQGTVVLPANGRLLFGQTANAAEGAATVDYVYGSTFVMPTASGSIGLGVLGATYASLSWTTAGTQGQSFQVADRRTDLLYNTTTTVLSCPAYAPYGASGQKGTPGTANSTCFRWSVSPVPGAFLSIAATGTAIAGLQSTTNNGIDTVSKTVDFTAAGGRAIRIGQEVYGNATTPLRVDSNGYITLSSTTNTGSNDSTPSTSGPNGTLAVFWDDLAGNAGTSANPSGVFWKQFDPDSTPASGDEYTLISWENWKAYFSDGSLNFQIKILEATGSIEYHYGTMTSTDASYANGSKATVWLESLDGKAALSVSVNQPNIQSNTGYRFTAY